jgi:hypothetical protein
MKKVRDFINPSRFCSCALLQPITNNGLTVGMPQVDFNAKTEYDYISNYKVLQEVFSKLNIDKHIEVQKLIKARPLDNMEFMQWFKSYFDNQTQGQGVPMYDGPGRRATCKTGALHTPESASLITRVLPNKRASHICPPAAGDIKGGKSAGTSRAGGVPRAAPGQLQHQGSSAAAPLSKRPSAKALNMHPSNAAAEVDELTAQVRPLSCIAGLCTLRSTMTAAAMPHSLLLACSAHVLGNASTDKGTVLTAIIQRKGCCQYLLPTPA